MDSLIENNLKAFVQSRCVPASYGNGVMKWQEEAYGFVLEPHDTHVVMSIALECPSTDREDFLLTLYRRAAPQCFLGLPVRVYGAGASIIAALAIPLNAVTLEELMGLHNRLRRLFEPQTFV